MKKSLSFFALLILTLAVAMPAFAGGIRFVTMGIQQPGFVDEDLTQEVWIIVDPGEILELGFSIGIGQANVAQQRINALTGFDPPTECDFGICKGLSHQELLMCIFKEQARCHEEAPVHVFAGWIDPSDPLCDYAIPFCKGAQLVNKTDCAFAIPISYLFRR